jgi:hypothetical protein
MEPTSIQTAPVNQSSGPRRVSVSFVEMISGAAVRGRSGKDAVLYERFV